MKHLFLLIWLLFLTACAGTHTPIKHRTHVTPPVSHGYDAYHLVKTVKIPGTYYFTPVALTRRFAAFGYVSKIKPTPQEVAQEKARIRRIIEGSIKREYGSMEGWEKENEKVAREAAGAMKKETPAWVQSILPPSLVQEAMPLLLKGALLYAMHSGEPTEPYGNLGETGIVLVGSDGDVHKIKLGLDEEVVSLEFSPDGSRLAAMTDLSYEDKAGRYHAVARITLVDTGTYRVKRQWIFANAVDEVKFTPDGKVLTFLMHNPKEWSEKAIRFIDLGSGRVMKKSLLFHCGDSTGDYYGMKRRAPCYVFAPNFNTLITREGGKLGFYDVRTLRRRFVTKGVGTFIAFAHHSPYLFELGGRNGRLIDYAKGAVLRKFEDPIRFGFVSAAFTPDDRKLVVSDHVRKIFIFDAESGRKMAETRFPARDGAALFDLSDDGRWIVAPHPVPNRFARYEGAIKRQKCDLKIIDARFLKTVQYIPLPVNQTVVAFGTMGENLFFSDFDTIYLYKEGERR